MYNRNSIFDYYEMDSIIHRLSPIYKCLSVLFMILFVVIASSAIDMVIVNLYIIVMVIFSDIGIRVYFNNLRVSKFFVFVVFIISLLFSKSLIYGVVWGIKAVDLIVYLFLMSMTSSFNSIVYGVEWLFKPINGIVKVNKIALRVGLVSKFITILHNESIRIKNSKELRGVMYNDLSFSDRITYLIGNIVSVYKMSIDKIRRVYDVMLVRNYGCFFSRSNYRLNKFGTFDTIMLGINVVVLVLIIVY